MNPIAVRQQYGPQKAGWYIAQAVKCLGMASAAIAVAYLLMLGIEGHMNPPQPPAWLYDYGEPTDIGEWRGHNACWAVVAYPGSSDVSGAVGCADGYREVW